MEGSYSDSALSVTSALDRVAELGMDAFAITDHGEMAMVPFFAREAAARGIKPIVGIEAYFVEDAAENIRKRINDRFHLTLLAADLKGYTNLIRLATRSWKDNCLMQKMGLVDWKTLEDCSEGLICLSGCLAGPVGWSYLKDRPDDADRYFGRFSELFGDRYFIEVYDHGMPEEKKAMEGLLALATRYGKRPVLTNDCHYLRPENWDLHDTLIKTRFGKPTDFALPYHQYFIKSPAEMRALELPSDYCDATLDVAEKISLSAFEIASHGAGSVTSPHLDSGPIETAFLGIALPIGPGKALEKAAGVMKLSRREQNELARMTPDEAKSRYPDVARIAEQIENLPVKPEPDTRRIVVARNLSSRIPLRRAEKLLFTMWNEHECLAAGAEIKPVEEFPELVPAARAAELYFEGLLEYKRKHLPKARTLFQSALELDENFHNARYQLALVEYYDDRIDDARRQFEEVLRRAPEFERLPHLHSHLGWCCFRRNDNEKALASFRTSVKDKEIPGSLLGLGLTLEKNGDEREAVRILMRLIEIAPDFPRLATAQKALTRMSDHAA